MPQPKTRKQLRQEATNAQQQLATVDAQLAALDTPEGLAAFLHAKQKTTDKEFQEAVSNELERLSLAELDVLEEAIEEAVDEVAEAAVESPEATDELPSEDVTPVTYRVRHVSGNVVANSLAATPTGDELASLASSAGLLVSDLSVEPE